MTLDDLRALLRDGRPGEALTAGRELLVHDADDPALIDAVCRAALEAGAADEALALLERQRRLLCEAGARPRAFYELGMLFRRAGALGRAAEALGHAARLRRDIPAPALAHAQVLLALGRREQAAAAAEHAHAVAGDDPGVLSEAGALLHQCGRLSAACALYERATGLDGGRESVYQNWALALMTLGRAGQAAAVSGQWLERHPASIGAMAFKAVSLAETADPRARSLLDFERFVQTTRVDPGAGYPSLQAFNRALEDYVLQHPTLATPDESHPTYHDPSLMISEEVLGPDRGAMARLEQEMRRAVDEYLAALDDDSGHPFVRQKPRAYRLTAWAAVLDRQGNQHPHIHEDGYLSGCYYVRVPAEVLGQEETGEGPIAGGFEIGRAPDELNCRDDPNVRTIKPEPGLMVLFPAYMFHRTIPFRSGEQRISIAFDVIRDH